jgi:ubiquinone/menaquinone biosynthesis C-methylase UbiE
MTALPAQIATDTADERLDWLCRHIATNRFLPVPPRSLHFIGDGDYRAIGAEFLGHFVRRGSLRPDERVLEIGCGVGRMALPLTQYLDPAKGRYHGVDIVRPGIEWCRAKISSVYANFRFHQLDLQHPVYNPSGRNATTQVQLPFGDDSFDFVYLTSVLTHLSAAEVRAYAKEIARVLAPGGRCFVTAFMMNGPAREALRKTGGRPPFDPEAAGPEYHAYAESPMAAVAFDEDALLAIFLEAGLRRKRPASYGHWSGRPLPDFQDISILEHR